MKVKSESEVTQSCLSLRDLMDCCLPGSSIHGIFQAKVLEWGAVAFSHSASLRLFTHQRIPPIFFLPPNHSNHQSTFCAMNLTLLDNSPKWNYVVFVFLWLTYFTYHNILKFHSCATALFFIVMPSPGISMLCKSKQTPQGSACFYKTWKEDADYCVSYTIW